MTAIDLYIPTKTVTIHHIDKPWMTESIKQLILDRQREYHLGLDEQWGHKVRDAICQRKDFYREKVQHLRTNDPRKWWKTVNNISGKSDDITSISYQDETGNVISGVNLVARPDKFYASAVSRPWDQMGFLTVFERSSPSSFTFQ